MLTVQNGQSIEDSTLIEAGYTKTHIPDSWEDIGGPESGPKLVGGPAYDDWSNGDHHIYVINGVVQESETWPPRLPGMSLSLSSISNSPSAV